VTLCQKVIKFNTLTHTHPLLSGIPQSSGIGIPSIKNAMYIYTYMLVTLRNVKLGHS